MGVTYRRNRIGSMHGFKTLSLSVVQQQYPNAHNPNVVASSYVFDPYLPSEMRLLFQARAHEINQLGVAEAAAILAKGQAEAQVRGSVQPLSLSFFFSFLFFSCRAHGLR